LPNFHGSLNAKPSYKYVIHNEIEDEFTIDDIENDTDKIKPNFIVKAGDKKVVVSTWVSAKRTRSYPFSRVLRTLYQKDMKKITIIPVVKDEGKDGDRDYLQFATISMMTFLGVYVIPAYYVDAEKNMRPKEAHKEKITNQKFDSNFIANKIQEILNTSDDVQTWNNSIRDSISNLASKIKENYQRISNKTGVTLHDLEKLYNRLQKFAPETYKDLSRKASAGAARTESKTSNPKEKTFGFPKARITFKIPKIDGLCNLTTDGFHIIEKTLFLLECKHGKNSVPKIEDVEDALFKYHFFNEFEELSNENSSYKSRTVIVVSSGGKTTKEISDELKDISNECKKNSVIFIPIGKDDLKNGKKKIIEKLNSIKN